jgi:hypothetical protein
VAVQENVPNQINPANCSSWRVAVDSEMNTSSIPLPSGVVNGIVDGSRPWALYYVSENASAQGVNGAAP